MGSWSAFLLAYFLGGITFIPLLLVILLVHANYVFPKRQDVKATPPTSAASTTIDTRDDTSIVQPGDDTSGLEKHGDEKRSGERLDVASGYFAVCREYTPMGINAKPIERSTPVGNATVAAPSPSVYQSMYRSIFDRKNGPPGSAENSGMSQRPKKAGNVFYVVLRHGHLMLFDDEEQLEVRHVISLAHHDVSVYSGGDVTPEGELWIKRNAIRLSRKSEGGPDGQPSKPFYLFSENCSAKEDFYFALLKNQEQTFGANAGAPKPQHFEVKNIISLVQKLHSSEDNIHSRWINAIIGRVFLGVYQTKDITTYISEKITKKIARVKKPSFLTNVSIQKIDTGDAAPYFNNFKLKDLTVEGECVVEADVKYTGNFRLEIVATAKIDLGTRFKAREVNLVLAVVLKKIEGHVLFKIKPPPSNRVWVSFQTMPKMEMVIEPIVSARQITYTVILRQIENRIKEVLAETLVQPFWDDIPFFRTEHKKWRGGVWEGDDAVVKSELPEEDVLAGDGDVKGVERKEGDTDLLDVTRPMEKSLSMPITPGPSQTNPTGVFGRKLKAAKVPAPSASSTSIETKPPSGTQSPGNFAQPPEPLVETHAAHADLFKPSTSPPGDATNYMHSIHSRSTDVSPAVTPIGSPSKPSSLAKAGSGSTDSLVGNQIGDGETEQPEIKVVPSGRRNTASSAESASTKDETSEGGSQTSRTTFKDQAGSLGRSFFMRRADSNISSTSLGSDSNASSNSQAKKNTLAAVAGAAAQARQWGWNAIQRQKEGRRNSDAPNHPVDLSQPMGRGQPLPPPGTPLPGPSNGKKAGPIPVPKRKPVQSGSAQGSDKTSGSSGEDAPPAPALPRRRRGASHDNVDNENQQEMLIIAMPDESEPDTPGVDERVDYLGGVEPVGATSAGSSNLNVVNAIDDGASMKSIEEEIQQSTKPTQPAQMETGAADEALVTSPDESQQQELDKDDPLQASKADLDIAAALDPKIAPTSDSASYAVPASKAPNANDAGDDDDLSGWLDETADSDRLEEQRPSVAAAKAVDAKEI